MKLTYIFTFLFGVFAFSQSDFEFVTEYKLKPNGEYAQESYKFEFYHKNGVLIETDLDLGHTKQYWLDYFDSSYSNDGTMFIVVYGTNFQKHIESGLDDGELTTFTLVYDEKKGNLLYFKIQPNHHLYNKFFLTPKGKRIRESRLNKQ